MPKNNEGTRYVSMSLEEVFGNEDIVNTVIISEFAESSLDVAGDTAIKLNRGFGRNTRHIAPGPYIPQGDVTAVLSASFFPYIAYGLGKYRYANNIHYFWNTDGRIAPSYQIAVGKDKVEHVFFGCILSSLNLSCDKEYADCTASYVCKKDLLNGPAKGIQDLNPIKEEPISFSQVQINLDGRDITRTQVLKALSISIENNADAESGVGLGDIHTKQIVLGEATATVSFERLFLDTEFLTMFKEGEKHSLEVSFTDNANNYVKFYFPALYISNVEQKASGREAINQPITLEAMAGNCMLGDEIINTDFMISVSNEETEYTF